MERFFTSFTSNGGYGHTSVSIEWDMLQSHKLENQYTQCTEIPELPEGAILFANVEDSGCIQSPYRNRVYLLPKEHSSRVNIVLWTINKGRNIDGDIYVENKILLWSWDHNISKSAPMGLRTPIDALRAQMEGWIAADEQQQNDWLEYNQD